MIWQGETINQKEIREKRGVRLYAYLPLQMNNGKWIWREYYWEALHKGPNNRSWYVASLDRESCIQKEIVRPPPPSFIGNTSVMKK